MWPFRKPIEQQKPIPFCEDCKWFAKRQNDVPNTLGKCSHPSAGGAKQRHVARDAGLEDMPYCCNEREDWLYQKNCGSKARLFEPKPASPPKPVPPPHDAEIRSMDLSLMAISDALRMINDKLPLRKRK